MKYAEKLKHLMEKDMTHLDPWIKGSMTQKFLATKKETVIFPTNSKSLKVYTEEFVIDSLECQGFEIAVQEGLTGRNYLISLPK